MPFFGSSWLEDTEDDRPLFGRHWLEDTDFEYYLTDEGEYKKIKTKRELNDAINNDNRFTFDGVKYTKKDNL